MLIYNLPLEDKLRDVKQQLDEINKVISQAEVPKIADYLNPLNRASVATKAAIKALADLDYAIDELNTRLKK